MIKASELRLENLISYNGEPIPIFSIDRGCRSFYIINDIQINKNTGCTVKGGEDVFSPIPLVGEWLEKFGFTLSDDLFYEMDSGRKWFSIQLEQGLASIVFRHDIGVDANYISSCEHVHQLQNLYFALTGEELTIQQRDISPS